MFGAWITGIIVVLIVIGIYRWAFTRRAYLLRLQQVGMLTYGTVVDVIVRKDSEGSKTYTSVIGYTAHDNVYRTHELSNKKKSIGDVLTLMYDPAFPSKPEVAPLRPEMVFVWATIGALVVIATGTFIALGALGIIQSSGGDDAALLLPVLSLHRIQLRSKSKKL